MPSSSPYHRLVEAAKSLSGTEIFSAFDEPSDEDIRSFLVRNREAMARARSCLGPDCGVPVRFHKDFFPENFDSIEVLRNLMKAFTFQARKARSMPDYPAAVRIGLDMLELSNAMRRGGLILNLLFASGGVRSAIENLRKVRQCLDGSQRDALVEELSRLGREREDAWEIVARARAWDAEVGRDSRPFEAPKFELIDPDKCGCSEAEQRKVHEALVSFIQGLSSMSDEEKESCYVGADLHAVALMRMLAVDLALRSYFEEMRALPYDLTFLAWRLPEELLEDPFTSEPFRYQYKGDRFELYSPGPTCVDHGGLFGPWPAVLAGEADLCLDAVDYEDEWRARCAD